MSIAFLIGRIIFGAYWLMASFNHFKNLNYMSEFAKARGTPSPKLAVAGSGVILLLGGLSMLLGVYPVIGIALLIIFLLGVSLQMHTFWKVDDAQMEQIDMINFTKNTRLYGQDIQRHLQFRNGRTEFGMLSNLLLQGFQNLVST